MTSDTHGTPAPHGDGLWYVSFHGGDGPHARNNIHRYDRAGRHLGKSLESESLPHGLHLREVRGFVFGPDGDLYVANAYKDASQILRFGGTPDRDGRHPFRDVFISQRHADRGLAHPFSADFGPEGHLYVPSQDTDIVGRYAGPLATDVAPGTPMAHPPALRDLPEGALPAGTFVPSARHSTTGLRAVRHAIIGEGGDLYVADRASNAVKRYDRATGVLKREYRDPLLVAPVHLLSWPERHLLLVGSRDRDAVVGLDPATGAAAEVVPSRAGGLKAPSGLAWGPDGLLHVGSRTGRAVLRFDAAAGRPADPLLTGLEDEPEFVRWVAPARRAV